MTWGRGFTAPELHDSCFSRYAFINVRLSLSFSLSITTINSQGWRLFAEGALIANSRICAIVPLATESGLNALTLLLSLITSRIFIGFSSLFEFALYKKIRYIILPILSICFINEFMRMLHSRNM